MNACRKEERWQPEEGVEQRGGGNEGAKERINKRRGRKEGHR
jgi:hypothetical protein